MKFLYPFILFIICSSICLGQTHTDTEERNYVDAPTPGDLYFVETKILTDSEYVFTNNLEDMWYPSRIETWYSTAVASTNTFIHIYKNIAVDILDYEVVTNDFGDVATNYLHAITNTVTTYVTNTIASWEHTAALRAVATEADTKDYFVSKGDIIKFVSGITNACRVRFIGRR